MAWGYKYDPYKDDWEEAWVDEPEYPEPDWAQMQADDLARQQAQEAEEYFQSLEQGGQANVP